MSVLEKIGGDLMAFAFDFLGEEKVHELGGEFLGTPYEPSNPLFNKIDEIVHTSGLFADWLWFGYIHEGKTVAEWYRDEQHDMAYDVLQLLNQMIESQCFSLFKLGEVKPGNIECIDLRSGVHYRVREYSMAHQVKTGQSCGRSHQFC